MLNKNIITNIYGLSRSLFALSLLLTLLFTSTDFLFPEGYLQHLYSNNFFSKINLFLLFNYDQIWLSKFIGILILTSVILGYYPRFTGILQWWVSFSFFNASLIVEGGDQVISIFTLLLIPITLLDKRKNHWNKPQQLSENSILISNLFWLLIKIQASIIYLQAGIEKLYKVEEWRNGTAIYYWFNDPVFGAPDYLINFFNYLFQFPFFSTLITWSVIALEIILSFSILITNNRYKFILLKCGLLFHFMIVLMHGLPSFFLAMSGLLILYLLPLEKQIDFRKKIKHQIISE